MSPTQGSVGFCPLVKASIANSVNSRCKTPSFGSVTLSATSGYRLMRLKPIARTRIQTTIRFSGSANRRTVAIASYLAIDNLYSGIPAGNALRIRGVKPRQAKPVETLRGAVLLIQVRKINLGVISELVRRRRLAIGTRESAMGSPTAALGPGAIAFRSTF